VRFEHCNEPRTEPAVRFAAHKLATSRRS